MDGYQTHEDDPDVGVDRNPNVQKVEAAQRGCGGDQKAKVHGPAGPRPPPHASRGDAFGRRFSQHPAKFRSLDRLMGHCRGIATGEQPSDSRRECRHGEEDEEEVG